MSRSTLRTIFAFSVIIEIFSIFLFYITEPSEPGFVPIVMSFGFALAVSILSLIFYRKKAIEENFNVNILLIACILIGAELMAIAIRVLILITNN